MNRIVSVRKFLGLAAFGAVALLLPKPASAASIMIVVGSDTCTITDSNSVNQSCTGAVSGTLTGDHNAATGAVQVTGSFDGWDIPDAFFTASGISLGPGTDSMDLGVQAICRVAAAGGSTCATIDIFFTDTSFTTPIPAGAFKNSLPTDNASSAQGSPTVQQCAWVGLSNTAFQESAPAIPCVNGGQTSFGGPAGVAPYSLTMEQIFTGFVPDASFILSTDGSLTASPAPEPASLLLLGSGLVGLAGVGRSRYKARRRPS